MSATILRPNQRVRISVPTDDFVMRFRGAVAWAKFELPKPTEPPRYRAGVEFSRRRRGFVQHMRRTCTARCKFKLRSRELDSARLTANRERAGLSTPSRRIVSSRPDPVETMAAGTPVISSSRAT